MAGSIPASLSADAAPGAAAARPGPARPGRSPAWEAWRRFRRHRLAVASLVVLTLMVAGIALGPLLWRVPIDDIDFSAQLAPPSAGHPFGTDDLGQDLLARMIYGGRVSLAVGLAAMVVAVVMGLLVGAVSGMAAGWLDAVLMWLTDLFLSLPQLPLLLLAHLPVPQCAQQRAGPGSRAVRADRARHRRAALDAGRAAGAGTVLLACGRRSSWRPPRRSAPPDCGSWFGTSCQTPSGR